MGYAPREALLPSFAAWVIGASWWWASVESARLAGPFYSRPVSTGDEFDEHNHEFVLGFPEDDDEPERPQRRSKKRGGRSKRKAQRAEESHENHEDIYATDIFDNLAKWGLAEKTDAQPRAEKKHGKKGGKAKAKEEPEVIIAAKEEEDDSDEDLFLHSAFATHRKPQMLFAGDEEDKANDDAQDDLMYHVRAGAVRVNGEHFDVTSREEALQTARLPEYHPEDELSVGAEDDDGDEVGPEEESADGEHYDEADASSTSDSHGAESSNHDSAEEPPPASGDAAPQVSTMHFGEHGTERFRCFFKHSEAGPISPWHDIPLSATSSRADMFMMVTENPRMTRLQQRMVMRERMNPMALVMDMGEVVRFAEPTLWNLGFLPQTWLDPQQVDPDIGIRGSGGPVEVLEIGRNEHARGEVTEVRVLGAIPMVEYGTLRWKVIVVDVKDPLAELFKPAFNSGAWEPELLDAIYEWFGHTGLNGGTILDFVPQRTALSVVVEAHAAWRRLRSGDAEQSGSWVGAQQQQQQARRARRTSSGARSAVLRKLLEGAREPGLREPLAGVSQ